MRQRCRRCFVFSSKTRNLWLVYIVYAGGKWMVNYI